MSGPVCAPATPGGRGALAVIRATGPGLKALALDRTGKNLADRHATLVDWRDRNGAVIDRCLVTWFNPPRTYTGEEVLELSVHGNPLLVRAVLEDMHASGIPLAGPGEFTRRAVAHGRIPLSQAESVGALIGAETEAALEGARRVLVGGLQDCLFPLRDKLLQLSARLELEMDFAEEDATPEGLDLVPWIDQASLAVTSLLEAHQRLAQRALAPRAVLTGAPNAGKSSLINALLGEDRLLVSPMAGTTRDWVEVPVPTSRGTIHLVDTAGLGTPRDELDALAQTRTLTEVKRAHLGLVVVPANQPLSASEQALLLEPERWILVRTKSDLVATAAPNEPGHRVSIQSKEGLEELRGLLAQRLLPDHFDTSEIALVGQRQAQAARDALDALARARHELLATRLEIAAFEVRQAIGHLQDLLGSVTSNEVLAVLFSSFCIGK